MNSEPEQLKPGTYTQLTAACIEALLDPDAPHSYQQTAVESLMRLGRRLDKVYAYLLEQEKNDSV